MKFERIKIAIHSIGTSSMYVMERDKDFNDLKHTRTFATGQISGMKNLIEIEESLSENEVELLLHELEQEKIIINKKFKECYKRLIDDYW